MEAERLQKILAKAGYGSRRACEHMIEEGRVCVEGRIAKLGDKADPSTHRITLDGVPIHRPKSHVYIMLHKPRGYISTTDDPEGRRTVLDLVSVPQRLYPVGRLDADSEGLILLTDDGELTQHLTHPSYGHARVYRVKVRGIPDEDTLDRWHRGITLNGKRARLNTVEIESQDQDKTWLRVIVYEGRKHLVRRLVAALGHPAMRLIRVAMGPLQLGKLARGRWRKLSVYEIDTLRKEVGIAKAPRNRAPSKSRGPDKKQRRNR